MTMVIDARKHDKRTPEQRRREIEAAVGDLREVIERFIIAAENEDFTATKKMLEISVEVEPAMQAVVKAKTGVRF